MARVKRGTTTHAKHKRVLEQAKGFSGRRNNTIRIAKQAVEKAGSFETEAVRQAFRSGLEFAGPGGTVRLDPKTQHTAKYCRIGRIRLDRQFDIVWESPEPIHPDPYPQVAFPGWKCDWTAGGITRGAEVSLDGDL